MITTAIATEYNKPETFPKIPNNKDKFLGEEKNMPDNSANAVLYEKLSEIKNDIKSEMKLEFDKLSSKIDATSSLVVELRIKNIAMEKDIEALKVANNNKNKWIDYAVTFFVSALMSFIMTRYK